MTRSMRSPPADATPRHEPADAIDFVTMVIAMGGAGRGPSAGHARACRIKDSGESIPRLDQKGAASAMTA